MYLAQLSGTSAGAAHNQRRIFMFYHGGVANVCVVASEVSSWGQLAPAIPVSSSCAAEQAGRVATGQGVYVVLTWAKRRMTEPAGLLSCVGVYLVALAGLR